MVSRQEISTSTEVAEQATEEAGAWVINDHPAVLVPDVSFLFEGRFEQVGFDLVITHPNGETFVVADYFSYIPPPNLMMPSGAGFSPEMVMAKLHLAFGEEVMFAGPAASATTLVEVGKVTLLLGKVTVLRRAADGTLEEVTLKRGDLLYKGDEISTGGRAFIKAQMLDGTRFHLGKNAQAILSDFEFNETAKTGNFEAYVFRGGFHYKSGKIGKMFAGLSKSHSTISTPSATIGIRGSELDGNVDEQGNTTIVHRSGILSITDINGQNEVLLDTPGNTSIITFNGAPDKFEAPSQQHIETLNENLPPPDTPDELVDAEETTAEEEEVEETQAEGERPEEEPSEEATEEVLEEVLEEAQEEAPEEEAEEEPVEASEAEDNAPEEATEGEERASRDGATEGEEGQERPQGQQATGQNQPNTQTRPAQNTGDDPPADSPDGITIRESAFSENNADVIGDSQDVVTGTGQDDSTRSSEDGSQTVAGNELEILDIPENEERETTSLDEEEKPELQPEELPPDNPPIARDDFLLVEEPGPQDITGLLLANDSDGDAGQTPRLVQVVPTGSLGGTIQVSSNGTVVYEPNPDVLDNLGGGETATETFQYQVVSGDLTDTATLTVQLVGNNLAPIANDDESEAEEDSPITIDALANDEDPDGDSLTIVEVDSETARGSVEIAADGKGLVYLPPDDLVAGEVGIDTFAYRISDGQLTSTATISVRIVGRNDAPVAITDGEPFVVEAGAGATVIPLSAIFTDADLGDELTVVSIDTSGTLGSVQIGSIIYDDAGVFRPLAEGELAADTFGVTVQDQFGALGSAEFTVEITGINDRPEPFDDAYTVLSGEPFSPAEAGALGDGGLLANDFDIDNGATLRVNTNPVTPPSNGTLVLQSNGLFTYTANEGFVGTDSFEYQVIDEFGATQKATVTLTVTDINTPPVTAPDNYTVSSAGSLTGNVLNNDLDPEGLALTATLVSPPAAGTVLLSSSGQFTYQPDAAGSVGPDTFTYAATDPFGDSTIETVTINVVADNLPPDAILIGDKSIPAGLPSTIDLADFFTDPEGSELIFDFSTEAGFVTLTGSVLGAMPPAAAEGTGFVIQVSASDGENVTTQDINVTVSPPNLPPEVAAAVADQGVITQAPVSVDLSGTFIDPEGDPLTLFLDTDATFLTLTGDTLGGTPAAGDEGTYLVTLRAEDEFGSATTTFSLTVTTAPPPPPPAVNITVTNDSITVLEGGSGTEGDLASLNADLLIGAVDADGDPLTTIAAGPILSDGGFGTVTINTDGTFSYTHDDSENLTDSFTFQVTDGTNVSTGTVTVTVTGVNDNPPMPDNEDIALAPGGTATVANLQAGLSLLDGDTDLDGDPLTTVAAGPIPSDGGFGTVTINTDGTFSYTHDGSANFSDFFTYQVTDGGTTVTATVNITIIPPANSPPSGNVLITGNTEFGSILTADASGVTDPDGPLGTLTYEWFVGGISVAGPSTASSTYTTTLADVGKDVRVEVSYTDPASNMELVSSGLVFVAPQAPNYTGTPAYQLIPSLGEFLGGTPGPDTLTLSGTAESDDFFDLDDGTDTIQLDNTPNVLFVEEVENILDGGGADTITILGDLFSIAGIITSRDATDVVNNDAFIQLSSETAASGGGDFQNLVNATLELGGPGGSDITFDTFSNNMGSIVLDLGSTLSVAGVFSNNGYFESRDSVGGSPANEFSGTFINAGGTLGISHDLTFLPGSSLDVSGGSVFIDFTTTLTIDGSTLTVSSPITADSTAIILFNNVSTLTIAGSYTIDAGSPFHDFAGTVTVNGGIFNVGPGAYLELTGDDINSNLMNSGQIFVKSGTTTLDGGFSQTTSGELILDSNTISGSAGITDSTGFMSNSGLIELNNSDGSAFVSTLTVNILTNSSQGVIESRDDDMSLGGGSHVIDAQLNNNGTIILNANLSLPAAGANHANDGDIELIGGTTLFITNATSFTNQMSKSITGSGVIDSNVPILSMGVLEPDSPDPSGVDLMFTGDLDLEASSVIHLDIFTNAGDHDQVLVSGQLDVEGEIDLVFYSTAGIAGGGIIDNVISYGTLGGNTTFGTVNHNLGAAYTVTVDDDAGGNYDINITTNFDINAINPTDWSLTSTWSPTVVPTSGDDVQISGFDVTHTGAGTDTANSLTILASGSLDISNGTVELLAQSRVDGTSNLDVNNTGSLKIEDELIIEGALNWDDGAITTAGSGSVTILGSLNLFPGGSTDVDAPINNHGTVYIDGGGTLFGNSPLNSFGQTIVLMTTDLDLPINNIEGTISIGSAFNNANVTHSQNINNDATYILDTPAGFNTSLILNNANFTNNFGGTLMILDTGVSAGTRVINLNQNGHQLINNGLIDVQSNVQIDVELATLDTTNGEINVTSGFDLTIDGGASGGIFIIGSSTQFTGLGNINIVGDVTLNVASPAFLNTSIYFDTSGGDLTITGSTLTIDGPTALELNNNDHVNNSNLEIVGTLRLIGDGIIISAALDNYGSLEVLSDSNTGLKTIDNSFTNQGNLILDQISTDQNILEVGMGGGTAILTNDISGFIQSSDSGGAVNPNILRGTLVNHGILLVDHDLDLDETGVPVQHDNYNEIHIAAGQTLTLGANNDLQNVYDPDMGYFGEISGFGTLDVSGTGVNFINEGLIAPGASTGILTIVGNANTVFGHDSIVEIELNGNTPGSGHDQLVFGGVTPALNGRLKVEALSPPSGSYTIITSTGLGVIFSVIEGTDLYASDGVVLDVTKTNSDQDLTLTAVAPTVFGGAGDDVALSATAGTDVIHGDDGNDVISGVSTGDVVFGGHGHDTISTDMNFKRINGGDGADTLTVTGATVDLTTIEGYQLEFIDALNFDGNGAQLVTLDADVIWRITDDENELTFQDGQIVVLGDSSDHLVLLGDYDLVGNDFFDVRNPGTFEEFLELRQTSTMTGTTSVYIDDQMLVEVQRNDSSRHYYGSSGADNIAFLAGNQTTVNNDFIDGRGGDDFLDGGPGDDVIFGGDGDDTIAYESTDTGPVSGGNDVDTLLDQSPGATINLSGVSHFMDFERIDIMDGDGNDNLTLDLVGLGNMIGDNSLDTLLPINLGYKKMAITGDIGDVVNLAGNDLTNITGATLVGGLTSDFIESNYLGDGEMYIRFSDNTGLDLYIHANLVDDNPIL